jgi:hypothetical protein
VLLEACVNGCVRFFIALSALDKEALWQGESFFALKQ